jgi:hypothetical protein
LRIVPENFESKVKPKAPLYKLRQRNLPEFILTNHSTNGKLYKAQSGRFREKQLVGKN